MSENLEFQVAQEYRGSYHQGRLKIAPTAISFKNTKTSKVDQLHADDIESAQWLKRSKGHAIRLVLKSGCVHRFDGLADADFDKLATFFKRTLKIDLEKCDSALKGWNWGKTQFVGDALNFEVDGKLAFEIPLKNVSNTNSSKNEGTLQFHQNEDASISLMEIRFHIPTGETDTGDSAQEFCHKVLNRADIVATEDDVICTLSELNCITPRGRYDVKFFSDFIDLHGKTFDYKIQYDHMLRLFLLPHKQNKQMYFVIALDPPIKQGQTRYPFLIVLFNNDDTTSVDLSISDKTKEKFGDRIDKLEKNISGPYHEVVSRICRAVLDKRITVPGAFTSVSGAKCLVCSYKANSGFLYPLERGFMFVHKPPLHILFQDIGAVTFSRSNQGHVRSFDFEIDHKNGTKHVFSNIEKNEQERLQEYVKQKQIHVKASGKDYQSNLKDIVRDDHDPYAERMKAEGREKDDEDDDDEEDDEDFKAGSETDDDLEYDSNASVDSDEDSDAASGGAGGSGSDDKKSGDDSEGEKAKSKKKKETNGKEKKPEKEKKAEKTKKKEKTPEKRKATKETKEKSKSSTDKAKKPKTSDSSAAQPKSAEFVESGDDSDD